MAAPELSPWNAAAEGEPGDCAHDEQLLSIQRLETNKQKKKGGGRVQRQRKATCVKGEED